MRYVCLLLMALVSGVGCFHFPFVDKGDAKSSTTVRRPPVLPEQVKDTTAHKVAEALEEGLLDDLDPAALAGLVSCFVYEHRTAEPPPPPWFPTAQTRERYLTAYHRLVGKPLFPPKPRNET